MADTTHRMHAIRKKLLALNYDQARGANACPRSGSPAHCRSEGGRLFRGGRGISRVLRQHKRAPTSTDCIEMQHHALGVRQLDVARAAWVRR